MNKEISFISLVENALMFAEHAAQCHEDHKHEIAIVCFATAVELFFKARLAKEHWALVLSVPSEVKSPTTLSTGEFHTLTFDKAISTCKNLLGDNIAGDTIKVFENLQDYRNKIVHCYHPDTTDIISVQCESWHELFIIIKNQWKKIFENHLEQIDSLNANLCKNRHFLQPKFKRLNNKLNGLKTAGHIIETCNSCGFQSFVSKNKINPNPTQNDLHENINEREEFDCLVCGFGRSIHYTDLFLKEYDQLVLNIQNKISNGQYLKPCRCINCEYETVTRKINTSQPQANSKFNIIDSAQCLMCNSEFKNVVFYNCENCHKTMVVTSTHAICMSCEDFSIESALIFENHTNHDGEYGHGELHCTSCFRTDVSTLEVESMYCCLSCFQLHESVDRCENCLTLQLGEGLGEDSFATGCEYCEGAYAKHFHTD